MNNMKYLVLICALAILALIVPQEASGNPSFAVDTPLHGETSNRWAFMTAWGLTTGDHSVSPSWYNGKYLWYHDVWYWNEWYAQFLYNQGTGRTAELVWYFCQIHVQ